MAHLFSHAILETPQDLDELSSNDKLSYRCPGCQLITTGNGNVNLLSSVSGSIIVIRRHEDLQCEIFNVSSSGSFIINRLVVR